MTWLVLLVVGVLTGVSLVLGAQDSAPLSLIDEHVHLDYATAVHRGELPYRGSVYSDEVVDEWTCGVGHESRTLRDLCGSPDVTAETLPSGRYSTAYIHYPTYFAAADAWRRALDAVFADVAPLTALRLFSAAAVVAGLGAGVALARSLGLRGSRLVAASLLPLASPLVLHLGVVVNPASLVVLEGALVAAAGIRWVTTGRGFLWLVAASALASVTAVIHALPVGAFLLATLVAVVGRRRWPVDGPWSPRWGHALVLGAVVLVPVAAWNRVVAARATVSNEAIFSSMTPAGVADVVNSFFYELVVLHQPWIEYEHFQPDGPSFVAGSLRALAAGLPLWIGPLVVVALVLLVVRTVPARGAAVPATPPATPPATVPAAQPGSGSADAPDDRDPPASPATRVRGRLDPLVLVTACALATFVLYAPVLRVSNVLTFEMDHPVVSRYSMALMPLFAYLVALAVPGRAAPRLLAAAAALTVVGTSVWWTT